MPSIRRKTTKAGRDYYEITVSRGRSLPRLFSRWYVPEGWSQRAIDRELAKVAAEFERQCKAGEVVSRREKRQQEAQEAEEAAKIQTVRQYGERVFMPAKAVTMSENSRASFQSALNTWIYPAIGDKKLPDVSPADLSALLLEIQAKGKAHATAVKVYTVLHTLFKMAYLADAIPRNPMDKVSRPVPRKDEIRETEAQALTVDELRAVLEALRGQSSGEYVFTQENSAEPMHPQSPTRYLKKLSAKCGVPDLHPHKLRHTFASVAITAGADVASVSEALGHSDKAVTLRMYTHADAESRRRAAQLFRDAIKKAGEDPQQDEKKTGQDV